MSDSNGPFTTAADLQVYGADMNATAKYWGDGRMSGFSSTWTPSSWVLGQDLINMSKAWNIDAISMYNCAVQGWTKISDDLGTPQSADVFSTNFPNPNDTEQKTTFDHTFSKTVTQSYSLSTGFSVSLSGGVKAPFVDLSMSLNATSSQVEASSTSIVNTYGSPLPIIIPPQKEVTVTATVMTTTGTAVFEGKVGVTGNIAMYLKDPSGNTLEAIWTDAPGALAAGGPPKVDTALITETYTQYAVHNTLAVGPVDGQLEHLMMCVAHPSGQANAALSEAALKKPTGFVAPRMVAAASAADQTSSRTMKLHLLFNKGSDDTTLRRFIADFCAAWVAGMGMGSRTPAKIVNGPKFVTPDANETDLVFGCGQTKLTDLELEQTVEKAFQVTHWPVMTTLTFVDN